jgi:hypothetical protein
MLFVQDEYEVCNKTRAAIQRLGINVVFSCVPEEFIPQVYPPETMPNVTFVPILTGYVPFDVPDGKDLKPPCRRPILIGYRGRNLGYWYGDLGQEKMFIGQKMKEICDQRQLPTDISWHEHDRIYGDAWFRFLGNCKATLGTESGANVFDHDGTLANDVQKALLRNPETTYEQIRERFLRGREGPVQMNQIAPKLFEAIACKTALVLFEGRYSGVLEPHRHYIPLKKDFSNVDDVLATLHDDAHLESLTERAFEEIVASGAYSYQTFVKKFDAVLSQFVPACGNHEQPSWLPLPPCDALTSFARNYRKNFLPHILKRFWRALPAPIRFVFAPVVNRQRLKNLWIRLPRPLKTVLHPLHHVRNIIVNRDH